MTPNVYDLGDLVTLTGLFFSDPAQATPADPTTVILSIRDGAGTITTPTPTRTSLGVWTYSWVPPSSGLFEIRWQGTGAVVSAQQSAIFVRQGITTGRDLCTLDEVKLAAGIPDNRDAITQMVITAASAAIAHRYQREFVDSGQGTTRRFELEGPRVSLAPYDLQSASAISLNPETSTPIPLTQNTDVILRPTGKTIAGTYTSLAISGLQTIFSTTTIRFGIAFLDVTGVWGFPVIPDDVRRAAILTAAAWTDRASGEYALDLDGVPGASAPPFAQTWAIPTAAHRLLQPFERMDYA